MEAKFFAESFSSLLSSLVNIDNLPSLGFASVVWPDTDLLAFNISSTNDIKSLVALPVDELVVLISENLPPSTVGAPDLHVSVSSGVGDIP